MQPRRNASSEVTPRLRNVGYWLIGGVAAGSVGAIAWVVAANLFGTTGGWLACGIGLLVGAGVRYAGWKANVDESKLEGFVAVTLTLLFIVGAKLILFLSGPVSSPFIGDAGRKLAEMRLDEEGAIASVADDLVIQEQRLGHTMTWPEGSNLMTATSQEEYPPEIWAEAVGRWQSMPESAKAKRTADRKKFSNALRLVRPQRFLDYFTPLDLFWMVLASITAYKIGVGTYRKND